MDVATVEQLEQFALGSRIIRVENYEVRNKYMKIINDSKLLYFKSLKMKILKLK